MDNATHWQGENGPQDNTGGARTSDPCCRDGSVYSVLGQKEDPAWDPLNRYHRQIALSTSVLNTTVAEIKLTSLKMSSSAGESYCQQCRLTRDVPHKRIVFRTTAEKEREHWVLHEWIPDGTISPATRNTLRTWHKLLSQRRWKCSRVHEGNWRLAGRTCSNGKTPPSRICFDRRHQGPSRNGPPRR